MRFSLLKILSQSLTEGENELAFIPMEVMILKTLNRIKKPGKNKENIIQDLKRILVNLGIDGNEAYYYYYLWALNYMENGEYRNLKKSEFKSLKELKQEKTKNYLLSTYLQSKIPFKGSNVEGIWESDPKGTEQYVVTSYKWYPIFIYKNNKWYRVSDSYSSSTGRHISNSNMYNQKLTKLNATEINQLRNGVEIDSILKNKEKKNYELLNSLIGKLYFTKVDFWSVHNGVRYIRIKWKINKIAEPENDKIKIIVEILNIDATTIDNRIIDRNIQFDLLDRENLEQIMSDIKWFMGRKLELWKELPQSTQDNLEIEIIDGRNN